MIGSLGQRKHDYGGVLEWGSWSTKLFYRFLNKTYDWEIEVVASFFNLLCSNMPFCESSDRLKWKFQKNGAFDVWSCPFMMHFGLV